MVHLAQLGWAIVISVVLGALIGGLTNFLAIVMLFRPHRPWKIGGWNVPFTPGLIPKRREELARQLGHVVEEYLFTSEGMIRLIRNGEVPYRISRILMERLKKWSASELTVAECIDAWSRYVPLPSTPSASVKGTDWHALLGRLLEQPLKSFQGQNLEEILDEDCGSWVREQIPRFSQVLLARLSERLNSLSGKRWLMHLIQDFVRTSLRGGRMWNTLASLVLDEERLAGWMQQRFMEWLAQPGTKEQLDRLLQQQWDKLSKKPLGDLRDVLGKEECRHCLDGLLRFFLDGERLRQIPVKELLRPFCSEPWELWLRQWLEEAEDRLIQLLPAIFRRLQIARVVEQQVLEYPLSQLEALILQVASRELKMITWLGALIGGLVGLVQGVWMYVVIG